MKVIDVPENNLTLTPPKNWDPEAHGECATISVQHDGTGYIVTLEFEPEEFAALLRGGKLKIKTFGPGFAPMTAWVAP